MSLSIPSADQYLKYLLLIFLTTCASIPDADAQVEQSSDFFQLLADTDSLLFQEGFNECNMEKVVVLISEDFEFYHDENGVQNRKEFLQGFKNSICSSPKRKPIRKLLPGSLEVFRLKNNGRTYGAIQKGVHQFYIKEPNKKLYLTSTAKFTHVWILENNDWKLKRVLSYDHEATSTNGD